MKAWMMNDKACMLSEWPLCVLMLTKFCTIGSSSDFRDHISLCL